MQAAQSVVVIGSGIIGASCAAQLARKGCKVTLLEAGSQPAQAATGKSWAWLNANRKEPAHYRDLNLQGMEEWREVGDLAEFPGTLYLADTREGCAEYPCQAVQPDEVAELEPCLSREAAAAGARLYRQEGFGYATEATRAFLAEARSSGADVRFSQPVAALHCHDGRVTGVTTAEGHYSPDVVVLAAGRGIPDLAAHAGVRIRLADKPATLNVYTEPAPPLLRHIVLSDALFLRQARDGTILISVYKEAYANELLPSPAAAEDPAKLEAIGRKVMAAAARLVPALNDVAVAHVAYTKYPYPEDGHPILGFCKECSNLYIAVMHSGATLGPLAGRLAAAEVTGCAAAAELDMLRPYRPDRTFGPDLAYSGDFGVLHAQKV